VVGVGGRTEVGEVGVSGGLNPSAAAPFCPPPSLLAVSWRAIAVLPGKPVSETAVPTGGRDCRIELVMDARLENGAAGSVVAPGPWWARRSLAASHNGNTQLRGENRCGAFLMFLEAPPQPQARCDRLY